MAIKMTDLDVLQDFYDIVRCGNLRGPYRFKQMKEHYKSIYVWRTYTKADIFNVVAEFYPLVCERRRAKFDEFLTHYQNGY